MGPTFFWHRRDLRTEDNHGLHEALKSGNPVQPIFIFDQNIIDELPREDDRIAFIHQGLEKVNKTYEQFGGKLWVFYGKPLEVLGKLINEFSPSAIFTNEDYEPYATQRDQGVEELCTQEGISFERFTDHLISKPGTVLKPDGKPYTVYTPYSKRWLTTFPPEEVRSFDMGELAQGLNQTKDTHWIYPRELGFTSEREFSDPAFDEKIISNYADTRNFPAVNGTTRLSVHLRFGTVSIRQCVQKAIEINSPTWLNELIWREFYQMILFHFPGNVQNAFRPIYDNIKWRNNEIEFKAWCEGKTGYPMVDAGMRELNATGHMHNRVRMVVASFLTKHLLIDWRWGEAYFARKLLDFELASNNGGWQWASGSGTDAAPYFRIFNPTSQATKFDPDRVYIKKWVPEIDELTYPQPIVDHKLARERCLDTYKKALK